MKRPMRYAGRLELIDDTSSETCVADMLTPEDRETLAVVFASARARMRHRYASSRVMQLEALAQRLGVKFKEGVAQC